MNEEELDQILQGMANENRRMIAEAAKQADEAVRRAASDLATARSLPPTVMTQQIVQLPVGYWRTKGRGVAMEILKMAAVVMIAVGASAAFVRWWWTPQPQQDARRSDWIPRNSTNSDAVMLRQLFPPGWRRASGAFGVSRFRASGLTPLPAARADVDAWAALSSDTLLIPPQHFVALHDERATEVGVRSALRWLAATFDKPQDQVFLYVSTHADTNGAFGLRIKLHDSDIDGGIAFQEVAEIFRSSRARVFVIVDVCYAGDIVERLSNWKSSLSVLAAASRNQYAFESKGAGLSVFATSFFELLGEKGDRDGNGLVTLNEIFTPLREDLRRRSAGDQVPRLLAPPTEDLALAVCRVTQDSLPPSGKPATPPAEIRFTLRDPGRYRVTLDKSDFGQVGQGDVALTVAEGKHELRVDSVAPPYVLDPNARSEGWSGEVTAAPGESVPIEVLVRHAPINGAQALAQSNGLFPILVRNPATASVATKWLEDGSLLLEFIWSREAPEKLTALFAADFQRGVSVPALLGLGTNGLAQIVFEARADDRDEIVTFFAGGGGGNESLMPPVKRQTSVPATSWNQYTLDLPASSTSRLVAGFGVEVAGSVERGLVRLRVKDVRLVKSK